MGSFAIRLKHPSGEQTILPDAACDRASSGIVPLTTRHSGNFVRVIDCNVSDYGIVICKINELDDLSTSLCFLTKNK